jgi:hypothetical protein
VTRLASRIRPQAVSEPTFFGWLGVIRFFPLVAACGLCHLARRQHPRPLDRARQTRIVPLPVVESSRHSSGKLAAREFPNNYLKVRQLPMTFARLHSGVEVRLCIRSHSFGCCLTRGVGSLDSKAAAGGEAFSGPEGPVPRTFRRFTLTFHPAAALS